MNKEQLLKLINSLKIDKKEFYIVSSGSLVLRGIFPDAGDLDMAVSPKGLEQLKVQFDLESEGDDWFVVNDKIECLLKRDFYTREFRPYLCGDVYVQNIYEYYGQLLASKREKDKIKIPIVRDYIKKIQK